MNLFFGQRCTFKFENLLLVEPVYSGYDLYFLNNLTGAVEVEYEHEHLWIDFLWSLSKTIPEKSMRFKAVECFQTYPDGWDGDDNLTMTRIHDIIGWKEIEQYKLPVTMQDLPRPDSISWLPNFGIMDTETGRVRHIKSEREFDSLEDFETWVGSNSGMYRTW